MSSHPLQHQGFNMLDDHIRSMVNGSFDDCDALSSAQFIVLLEDIGQRLSPCESCVVWCGAVNGCGCGDGGCARALLSPQRHTRTHTRPRTRVRSHLCAAKRRAKRALGMISRSTLVPTRTHIIPCVPCSCDAHKLT